METMKVLIILIALFLLSSCEGKMEKPFVIVHKDITKSKIWAEYRYEDCRGRGSYFYEDRNKYSIGDTIK